MIFSKNKSLVCFSPQAAAKVRLVCFPCAGGGASMYRRWAQLMPDVEVWGANYPGREVLHGRPFATSIDELVDLLLESPEPWREKPLAVFGHSFGALVAFHVADRLQKQGVKTLGLLASARRAPHLPPTDTFCDLPDSQFLARLDCFGGVPAAIRHDPDMMAFYLPVIRADLQLNDRVPREPAAVIDAPVYVLSAKLDQVATTAELNAWQRSTSGRCVQKVYEGGHFYIQDDAAGFTASLRSILHTLQQQDDEELIAF